MSDFATLTAAELARGFALKDFSPVEVTQAMLSRTQWLNPALNAFYLVNADRALAAARRSEERWTRGVPIGPLDGVPTSIKDALLSANDDGYRGSAAYSDAAIHQTADAPVVARMREAGMIFLGKSTMPDFGILSSGVSSKHGVTRNPVRPDLTPGGSSAGAAASIAAGINPVAVGTDIVGSIRLPASFTGLIGVKPSQGRVPYYFPSSPCLVAGPMARTVGDAALLMNVIAGPDVRDFTALASDGTDYMAIAARELAGLQIGVIGDLGFGCEIDPEVAAAVERAARALERKGARLVAISPRFSPADLRQAERFYKVRCRTELSAQPEDRQQLAATVWNWSLEAEDLSAKGFYKLFNEIQIIRSRAYEMMEGLDGLLLASVSRPAYRAELPGFSATELFEPWANTFLFNLTEQPACSIPCGVTADGAPVGVQFVGPRFDDRGVFAMARALERLFPES